MRKIRTTTGNRRDIPLHGHEPHPDHTAGKTPGADNVTFGPNLANLHLNILLYGFRLSDEMVGIFGIMVERIE